MQNRIISKALSLTAAAVLSCTGVIGSGNWLPVHADEVIAESSASETMQKVIVKVSGDAVLASAAGEQIGAEYLDTAEAAAAESQIESVQARVQRSIREFYPELEVLYSYSTLFNGFYCELPASIVRQVRNLPYVEGVTVVPDTAELKMATAADLGGYPAYYDSTGCTGAGSVVCVIDSELDVTHPMFAPLAEDVETKISKEDIEALVSSGTLNVDCDADLAYRSNKLPFVLDYVEEDNRYDGVADPNMYHGTHVSGIAAGNAIEDQDGKMISGIAKDAQLIFLSVGANNLGGIDFGAAIAATEDAVKLGADVINMSWATEFEFFGVDPFAESITTAQNAGVMLCTSAGNSDNGADSYWNVITPENPDVCTLNDKSEIGSTALIVASADNCRTEKLSAFRVGDKQIAYGHAWDMNTWEPMEFSEMLEQGDYEYVYCGYGEAEDFEGLDLTGKIALVDEHVFDLTDPEAEPDDLTVKIQNAIAANAAGIIIISCSEMDGAYDFLSLDIFPAASVSPGDGLFMKEAENKILTNDREQILIDHPTEVSSYTSWGVKQSLDLRPDIMGIGGYVESAGYNQEENIMSGTSMSSPYLCGCVAELCQYMRKQGIELTGADKTLFIHNILMNSAVPYKVAIDDSEMYIMPRRQGAGMVNLDNMSRDKVLVTGDEGIAKVNLYDKLEDTFSFNLNMQNLSDEDIDFSNVKLELTAESYRYDEEFGGYLTMDQMQFPCTAQLSGLEHVDAGQTKTVGVTVTLDPDTVAYLEEGFVNGFFVEGYVILEGAENCCDITVPLLGFHGDWAKVPIVEKNTDLANVKMCDYGLMAGGQISKAVLAINDALQAAYADDSWNYEEYLTDEQRALLYDFSRTAAISPNGDGLADQFGLQMNMMRQCQYVITVVDEEGNVVAGPFDGVNHDKQYLLNAETEELLNNLPEGKYTFRFTANIDYATSYAEPQVYEKEFVIDTTAPAVNSEVIERDGRTILKLTATDESCLDGIYVLGKGIGGVASDIDPLENPDFCNNFLEAFSSYINGNMSWGFETYRKENTADLSAVGRLFSGRMSQADMEGYSVFDIIPAEDNTVTVEYDITDMTDYCIAAVDSAFNLSVVQTEDAAKSYIKSGFWMGAKGVYEFHNGYVNFTDFVEGVTTKYNYTLRNGVLTMKSKNETITVNVRTLTSNTMRFTLEDGESFLVEYQEGMYELDIFHPVWEMEEAIRNFLTNGSDIVIDSMSTEVVNYNDVRVTVVVKDEVVTYNLVFYGSVIADEVDTPFYFFPINIYETESDTIVPGTYSTVTDDGASFVTFNDDECTGYILSTANYDKKTFSYVFNEDDKTFTFTMDDSGESYSAPITSDENNGLYIYEPDPLYGYNIIALYYYSESPIDPNFIRQDRLVEMINSYMSYTTCSEVTEDDYNIGASFDCYYIEFNNGNKLFVNFFTGYAWDIFGDIYFDELPVIPEDAMTLDQLEEWAKNDYTLKTDFDAVYAISRYTNSGLVVIALMDAEAAYPIEFYFVDPTTGVGTDSTNAIVDLPQTGNNAPGSAAAASAAALMMLLGLGAAAGSGVIRRKKDCE